MGEKSCKYRKEKNKKSYYLPIGSDKWLPKKKSEAYIIKKKTEFNFVKVKIAVQQDTTLIKLTDRW